MKKWRSIHLLMTACKGKKTNFYLEGCWAYLYKCTCLFRTKTWKSLDFAETVGRCVHISDAVKRTFHLQHVIQFSYSHNLLVLMAMKLMAKFSSKAEVSLQLPSTWRRPSYTCQYHVLRNSTKVPLKLCLDWMLKQNWKQFSLHSRHIPFERLCK